MGRRKNYYHRNEQVLLSDFENRQKDQITLLLQRYSFILYSWYIIITDMKRDEIVFYKEHTDHRYNFVYFKIDTVHNLPIVYIDTPVGSYAFYFFVPVEIKPIASIYVYQDNSVPNLNDRDALKICLSNDDHIELDQVYYYDKNGTVTSHIIDYKFYDFIKYIVNQRIPIETRKKHYVVQENLERYYLMRYNKIINYD